MGHDPRRAVTWTRAGAAVLLASTACLGSPDPSPAPFAEVDPPRRYERAVAVAGQAVRDPKGRVLLTGRVLTQRGKPARGVTVTLERETSSLFPAPCFFGCTLPPRCAFSEETSTAGDGRFSVGLCRPGRDLSLFVTDPSGDAQAHLPVFFKSGRLSLPGLRLWEPRVSFAPSAGAVAWPELPLRGFGKLDRYELTFRSDIGRDAIVNPMWYQFEASTFETLDTRVLEDTSGEIVVAAHTVVTLRRRCRPGCGRVFTPSFTMGGIAYRGPGPPPSRAKPCFVGAPGGRRITPCYLTDGRFFRTGFDHYCSEQLPCGSDPRWLGIDLGSSRRIELVVARGCDFCRVFLSADGTSWREVPQTDYDSGLDTVSVHTPKRRMTARYVRVSDPEDLAELSYW